MDLIVAHTSEYLDEVRALFLEYAAFLGEDLCFQSFEEELASLPGKYAPPDGALLLARVEEKAVGCGALRRLDATTCEMKRLYVRPAFRGLGAGKALALRLIEEAIRRGYATMRLDTLDRLEAALKMYQAMGFVSTAPYYANPLPGVVYLELDLRKG